MGLVCQPVNQETAQHTESCSSDIVFSGNCLDDRMSALILVISSGLVGAKRSSKEQI